jgi:phage head-tail adaptor, putative, SPP1 family
MSYSSGMLKERIAILNRKDVTSGKYGIDSQGIEFEQVLCVWASVTWAKGVQAMNAGALDVYANVLVRIRWNNIITMRSRIEWQGHTYQIMPETFHADKMENTIQFNAALIVND